jgi:hypothetical protein
MTHQCSAQDAYLYILGIILQFHIQNFYKCIVFTHVFLTADCGANSAEHLVVLGFVKAGQNTAHIHELPSSSVIKDFFR